MLRRRYRALQSWYRHHVLDADHGLDPVQHDPVGSMLTEAEVAADPMLNFLGDARIVDYVDTRVPEVHREAGKLDEHRLRHNMLSSMPMAFSLAAVLRDADDRADIVRRLFDVDAAEIVDVVAEWAPPSPSEGKGNLLGDNTAFDIAIHYRTTERRSGLVGIETKYTEPLSDKEYLRPRYLEVTETSDWFQPGAADALVSKQTNQLWRQAMLGAVAEGAVADVVHIAVVGLRADDGLWSSVDHLLRHTDPDLVRTLTWEALVDGLSSTSLASFAALFSERYLDLSPLEGDDRVTPRPRRSSRGPHQRWLFTTTTSRLDVDHDAGGDGKWGRWTAATWRALSDPARVVTVPNRAPTELGESCGWWTPALHLMLYSLGWPSPATGLTRWLDAGRPLGDPTLALIDAIWGRHLDALEQWLHHGYAPLEQRVAADLDLPTPPRSEAVGRSTVSRASAATHNPSTGGADPLHLHAHIDHPTQPRTPRAVKLFDIDPSVPGPPRATLICLSYVGWYRTLHDLTTSLPASSAPSGWRIDVVVTPIGHLGTYRRSRRSGRWFAGQHRAHALGIVE